MLPTDDICYCESNGLVDVGVPGRFLQLNDCLHCGAGVSVNSCSLADSASEMEHPKDPREDATAFPCFMDSCDFEGNVDELLMHALNHHIRHVVIVEEEDWRRRPVMLPYDDHWMCDTKRFLLSSRFGLYVVSLHLTSDPVTVMVSIEGLDGHWRDFEVVFQTDSQAWAAQLRARTFAGHATETVVHVVGNSSSEALPLVYLKVDLDSSTAAEATSTAEEAFPAASEPNDHD